MEDDGPDMIIIKDETFDDGPGKCKPQATSKSSDKGAVNVNHINHILTVYILQHPHFTTFTFYFNGVQTLHSRAWNGTWTRGARNSSHTLQH